MKQQEFENRYRDQWHQFERFISHVERKPTVRNKHEASETTFQDIDFARAYRNICHALALAKQRNYSQHLVRYLNDLAVKGHQQFYQRKRVFSTTIIRFFSADFPALVRTEAATLLLATGMFLVPAAAMVVLTIENPELVYSVFSPSQVAEFESMYDPEARHIGRERQSDDDFFMFGYYIWNNIGISFRTFAGGIAFGLGSAFFLIYNGIVLGTVAGHLSDARFADTFYSFVITHSAFELTAIVLAGVAGLKMGTALISPGRQSRIEALTQASFAGVQILCGVVGMLVIAAFIEAYWSSLKFPVVAIKYGIGAITWIIVILYLALAGGKHES